MMKSLKNSSESIFINKYGVNIGFVYWICLLVLFIGFVYWICLWDLFMGFVYWICLLDL